MNTLRTHYRRHRLLLAFFLLASASLPAVWGQTPAPSASPDTAGNTVKMDTFTVTGYRQSLQESLDEKRRANLIVDVITAEDVGKFADTNVAESLSHLPGITVDQLWGQGERVSINGTDPDLNRTLLNGQTVATGDWYVLNQTGRNFNYTLLAPEVLGTAEVYKTSEARLPEGSIGGTIILHTREPLDMPADTVSGTFAQNYNDRSRSGHGNESILYSWRDAEKRYGFEVSLQNSFEHLRRDGLETYGESSPGNTIAGVNGGAPQYDVFNGNPDPANPGSYLGSEVGNATVAAQLAANPNAQYAKQGGVASFIQDRKRQGIQTAVQYKPTDELRFDFNLLWVRATFSDHNNEMYPAYQGGGQLDQVSIQNGVIQSGHITGGLLLGDAIFDPDSVTKTEVYDLKATWKHDPVEVIGQVGRTAAWGGSQRQVFAEAQLQNADYSFSNNGLSWSLDNPALATDPSQWTMANGAGYAFQQINKNSDGEKYAQLDVNIKTGLPFLKKVMTGAKYSNHDTSGSWTTTTPLLPDSFADFGTFPTPGNFLKGVPGATAQMEHHFLVNERNIVAFYNAQNLIYDKTQTDYLNTWTVGEKVKAAYAEIEFGADKLTGNVGVRYITTDQSSLGWMITPAGQTPANSADVSPSNLFRRYTNVLPSLNLIYSSSPDLLFRFGASQVIARQNFATLSPSFNPQDPPDPTQIGIAQGGNQALLPYRSNNFDLSAEWYLTRKSLLQFALFDRQIANYTTTYTTIETHYSSNLGANANYAVGRPIDGGKAQSRGFNLAWVQDLGHGFGITANYTFTASKAPANYAPNQYNSPIGALPYASRNSVNISPYYEGRHWSVHLTYAWRSDYVYYSSLNNQPNWVHAGAQIDASLGYRIDQHWTLSLDGTNLGDALYQQYLKAPAHFVTSEYKSGRRFEGAVHFSF
ncbi:MAG TPA: TonB-dependent receptor [Opitutaceae bacterium]|nr:TonB-dependent receptor [Opitutaceae bacterium]